MIVHNVLRRKLRSGLTVVAVAIAVGSVVALVGIANGFKDSFLDFYKASDVDIIVARMGSQRRLTSTLDEILASKIQAQPGVKDVVPGLVDVVSFPEANLFLVPVSGLVPETQVFNHFKVNKGRLLLKSDDRSIVLGVDLAATLGKDVGDSLDVVEGEAFQIVGLIESSNVLENGAILMPLPALQKLMGREGQISGVSVTVLDPQDRALVERLTRQIKELEPGLSVRTTKEHVESLTEIQIALAMAWLTSTVAIVIGMLGTLNTMFMSIQERTREIGILRALGWERSRVAMMILGESVTIGLAGGIAGTLAAVTFVRLLTRVPAVNGMIQGRIDVTVLAEGMLTAVLVGLLGGLLPALSVSKMKPAEALQT